MNIIVTEQEIIETPNYYKLGELVAKRYWQLKNESINSLNQQVVSEYVSSDGFDLCIICGKKSPYYSHAAIDCRVGYVEGAGQGCFHPEKCDIYK